MQLVGILQYNMLYVNGRDLCLRGCMFAVFVVRTALLGSRCTPLWSCPAVDPSGIRRSAWRLLPPCWLRPRCGPPFLCDYESGRKEDEMGLVVVVRGGV